ncbi:aspartate/glutamate racemase family protein [Tropicibacter naphthalenivorans]|uniref:Hydantoin racemase n=1 Tax=Tropicibacter naphthalenivorans TaxID=441103 RepID=A0A0P1GVQ7_9RHOB|nr:aspartate/glutamate racemase family protein [Tropicibacter naphthalenivorans]CUH80507.1 Hydantoin racemase [Tropicibacter naphthalenivorans]SMC87089.1 allantoin racemase [Tropicibacter naphthalenivorans]
MIVLINPNSTVSMTEAMLRSARQAAPGATFEGWTSHDGPPSIQGAEDGEAATGPLLKLVQKASDQGAEAIIIACFDDTALPQARALAACPVIGIGQAAYHMAALASDHFSVVTTMGVAVPILQSNVQAYGLGGQLAKVRASEVPVLALEQDPDAATSRVLDEVVAAETEDQVQTVALGCGGMTEISARAKGVTQVRLIDGVRAAAVVCAYLTGH